MIKSIEAGSILRILRIMLGFLLVLVGIAGLLLPIMPGFIFLIPGLVILSEYYPPLKRLLDWAKAKAHAERARFQQKRQA